MSQRRINFHQAGIAAVGLLLLIMSASCAWRYFESARCTNRMRVINQAALGWAVVHDGRLPLDLRSLSNALGSPRVLICPGDNSREAATSWDTFFSVNNSYSLTAGLPAADTGVFSLACGVHKKLAYPDGRIISHTRAISSPGFLLGLALALLVWGRFFVVHVRGRQSQEGGLDAAGLKRQVALRCEQYAAGSHMARALWYRRALLAAARKAVQAFAYFRHHGA